MNDKNQNQGSPDGKNNIAVADGRENLLQKYGTILYAAGAVILIVALAVVFYAIKINRDNDQASRLLGAAQNSKQFEDIIGKYPKSPAAPAALMAIASSRYASGDYDGASALYADFILKYPRHSMFTAAELGRVMCLEARGDVDKALLEFNSFLLTHPDNYLTPQALFGKARCLQITGKLTDAKIVYEDFIAAYPESKWRQQAESALHMIDRQLRAKQQGN